MRKTLSAIAISCPIVAADQSPFPPRTQSGFLLAPKVRLWARTCHGKTPFRGLGGSKPVRSGRESQAWNHVIHAGRLLFFIRLPHESAMPKASKLIAGALSEATPPVTIRKTYHPGGCGRTEATDLSPQIARGKVAYFAAKVPITRFFLVGPPKKLRVWRPFLRMPASLPLVNRNVNPKNFGNCFSAATGAPAHLYCPRASKNDFKPSENSPPCLRSNFAISLLRFTVPLSKGVPPRFDFALASKSQGLSP